MTERTVAILPMRHASERVPGKNYRPLAGRPLYHHVLQTLLSADGVDDVIIDTDSDLIIADASRHFPSVKVVIRPESLRDGDVPMNDVLMNTLAKIPADVVLQTHSTNPFLRTSTIEEALSRFAKRGTDFDSLFSVTRLQARLWDASNRPVNHDPANLLRTQDLEPLFVENSSFFIFTPSVLMETGRRIGPKARMFEMDQIEALDIDIESDFRLAEAVYDHAYSQ